MKILVMGLPGSGKTWFAERAQKALECAWYNADKIREMAGDWDFTPEGRKRQSDRMYCFAEFEKSYGRIVICDFVCPTAETREIFKADYTIWMNTIQEGRFEDTNKLFEPPKDSDLEITGYLADGEIRDIIRGIAKYRKEKAFS
jgi:adenylylsulfate kinase